MEYQFRAKQRDEAKRLESFLYEKLATWSHKNIKRAIDRKRAFVNGQSVYLAGWQLRHGDQVLFRPRPIDYPNQRPTEQKQALPQARGPKYHFIRILYEDEALLAADKPPHVDYDSFVLEMNAYLKRTHRPGYYPYLGQMHRLDKETSGILVFTKKKLANILSLQFKDRRIKKFYLAIVSGRLEQEQGLINKPIEKKRLSEGRKGRIVEEDDDTGKECLTEYWVQERYAEATLVRVRIKTGRTHQIRIHFQDMGHPIVGDKIYGDGSDILEGMPIKRQMLHAAEMELTHPVTKKKLQLLSPPPKDFEALVDHLRFKS